MSLIQSGKPLCVTKCARSASRQSTKQASRLCFVRDLLARRAEHPRSHGTAGSAAGEFCYLPFDPRLIYAAMACNMPQLKLIICALTLSFFQSIRAKRPLVPCVEAALRKGANVDQACYAPCSMPREESPSSRRIFTGALTSSHAPTLLFARTKAGVKWQVTWILR